MVTPRIGQEEGLFVTRFCFTALVVDKDPGIRCHNRITAYFLSCFGKITEYRHLDGTISYLNSGSLTKWISSKGCMILNKSDSDEVSNEISRGVVNHFVKQVETIFTSIIADRSDFYQRNHLLFSTGVDKLRAASSCESDIKVKTALDARISSLEKLAPYYQKLSNPETVKKLDTALKSFNKTISRFRTACFGTDRTQLSEDIARVDDHILQRKSSNVRVQKIFSDEAVRLYNQKHPKEVLEYDSAYHENLTQILEDLKKSNLELHNRFVGCLETKLDKLDTQLIEQLHVLQNKRDILQICEKV